MAAGFGGVERHCTPEEFKKLWIFTVSYLRDEKKLHHLLYAFNTDRFSSREEYLEKYPGDEWVDVIGFDIYQRNSSNEKFISDIDKMLSTLEEHCKRKKQDPCAYRIWMAICLIITGGPAHFLKAIGNHKISYVFGWRNAGAKSSGELEFYVPYKGQSTEKDFVKFYKDGKTLFGKDIKNEKLYK